MESEKAQTGRGRKKPEDEDSGDENIDFSDSASGKFRARVKKYSMPAQWVQAPLYQVNEVVYLTVPGQAQPAGPYVIVSSGLNGLYTIKRQDNGQMYSRSVSESELQVAV